MRNKKNLVKRWVSALLTLSMMLSMTAIPAFAAYGDGAEFDEQTGISGSAVATYAAAPDAFVDDADSSETGVYQTGLTVYVVTDNGAPTGKAYTADKAYDANKATAANLIDAAKTFNSYLVYENSRLYGVLFLQDDANSLWQTVVASMLNGKEIDGITLPMTITEVENAYDRKNFTASAVERIANDAPSNICVTDLLVYVLSVNAPAGVVYGSGDVDPLDFGDANYTSYLCYDGRILTGILFVQNGLATQWVVDAYALCDGLTIKGMDAQFVAAFDETSIDGSLVASLAADPSVLNVSGLKIFVINDIAEVVEGVPTSVEDENGIEPFGRIYTTSVPYDATSLTIDEAASHTSYVCYKDGVIAGLLFVENVEGTFEWTGKVKTLLGDLTAKGVVLPREYPAFLTASITVKESADPESIKDAAFAELRRAESYPIETIDWGEADFTTTGTVTATIEYSNGEMATVLFVVTVEPVADWEFVGTVEEITSISEHNADARKLLAYVNQNMTAKPVTNEAYAAALGKAMNMEVPAYTWAHCDTEYTAKGGVVYTFKQIYKGVEFVRTLSVTTATYADPVMKIDYTNGTVNTVVGMKWSLDRDIEVEKWYSCIEDMSILKDWVGETVYFVMAASDYADQSRIVSLEIPEYAEEPEFEPELVASSHTITVTNLSDFDDVEFSIDGKTWVQPELGAETLSFYNLYPDTEYTVYVRTCAWEGFFLASEKIGIGIYTTEEVKTESNLNYDELDDELGSITLDISVISEVSKNELIGTLSNGEFSKFNSVLSKYLRSYDEVEVAVKIRQTLEPGIFAEYETITMTIPYSLLSVAVTKAETEIVYQNEMVTITLSQDVLENLRKSSSAISLQTTKLTEAPTSSYLKFVKEQIKAGAAVYQLTYRCDSTELEGSKVSIPVENVNGNFGVTVIHVTTRGVKTEIDAEYNAANSSVTFSYKDDGYYVIVCNEKPTEPMNYYDIDMSFWGYEGIAYCYENGIMIGTDTNTFSPDNYISKAQIVTMLARLSGVNVDKEVTSTGFTDVRNDSWYAAAAKWAKDTGIVTTSYFDGEAAMTRQDIAGILYAYLTKVEDVVVSRDALYSVALYDDANLINSVNLTAVSYVRCLNIMNGVGENTFDPNGYVTRAQMATMAMRVDMLINS